jgi:hypothetical protein
MRRAPESRSPVPQTADRASKWFCLAAETSSENSQVPLIIQAPRLAGGSCDRGQSKNQLAPDARQGRETSCVLGYRPRLRHQIGRRRHRIPLDHCRMIDIRAAKAVDVMRLIFTEPRTDESKAFGGAVQGTELKSAGLTETLENDCWGNNRQPISQELGR